MYYWSGIYHKQLEKGQKYSALKKTVSMNILAYTKYPQHDDYHSMYTLYDKEHDNEIEDVLEIHFFEIGKAVKHYKNDKKHKWLKFLNTSDPKELEDFKKNNNDDFVEKGVNIVNTINADVRFRNIIQMIEESEHEKAHFIDMAEQRGREEGEVIGEKRGRAEERAEIIESMRQSGMTEEQIQSILGN